MIDNHLGEMIRLFTLIENDPLVMGMFPVGEAVTVGFTEGCLQVLPTE